MRPKLWPLLLMMMFAVAGCLSSGSAGIDDGGSDGANLDGDSDGGGDIGTKPDFDPESEFLLFIPPETSLCFGFAEGRDWRQELAMVGKIDLKPGYYILPRQSAGFSLELVERIVFGPDHQDLVPSADLAQVEPVFQDWGLYGQWSYFARKNYTGSGESYRLQVQLTVVKVYDQWPAEVELGAQPEAVVATAELLIGPGEKSLDEIQRFGLCALEESSRRLFTADTMAAEHLVLDVRQGLYGDSCLSTGETECLFFTRAELRLNEGLIDISDRLRLVYVGSHHNWNDRFLILLEPAIGDASFLLVVAPSFMGDPGQVLRLDVDGVEISRAEITAWQRQ